MLRRLGNILALFITKFIEWIVLGIKLFRPKCLVKELIFFKYNHYLYITKDYGDGMTELWACSARKPYDWQEREYPLGKIILGEWKQPKGFYNYAYAMQRNAQKLFQQVLKHIAKEKKLAYREVMVHKKKKVWTRDDYVEAGKTGHTKMIEKYGRPAVAFRWEKRAKKLSTSPKLRE